MSAAELAANTARHGPQWLRTSTACDWRSTLVVRSFMSLFTLCIVSENSDTSFFALWASCESSLAMRARSPLSCAFTTPRSRFSSAPSWSDVRLMSACGGLVTAHDVSQINQCLSPNTLLVACTHSPWLASRCHPSN